MTHIPRLFCYCGGEMKNRKSGVTIAVTLSDQDDRPYFKASADLWECVDCDTRVFRTATGACAHPHDPDYDTRFPSDYNVTVRG